MRLHLRQAGLALAVFVVSLGCVTVGSAQTFMLTGRVVSSADNSPIEGAIVDIYRTDIKGKYETKTDKKGSFGYPVPNVGAYTVVVSGKGLAPQYRVEVRPTANYKSLEFSIDKGDGFRPTLDDVNRSLKSPKEDPKEAEARAKAEAEHNKAVEEKGKFDSRKARFDAGVAAMNSKDYATSITELTAALEGLKGQDPEFYGELASVGGTNLAEVEYRVAVDYYNKKEKDAAKSHLQAGAKAIDLALSFNPASETTYAIQGKILLLLIDKYGDIDSVNTAATAFRKAADMEELDQKKKIGYLVNIGDVYRAAYMTDDAITAYKAAIAVDANNLSALYGIGLAAMGTPEQDAQKRLGIWQTAADYMKLFLDKAPGDPRAAEVKPLLDTLAKDYKIKPRPVK